MYKFWLRCLFIFLFITPTYADEVTDIYQVEIIIFEHTDPKRFSAENWPKFAGDLNTKNAIKLKSLKKGVPESIDTLEVLNALDEAGDEPVDKIIAESVTLVEPNELHLNEEAAKIKSSKTQKFILHTGWIQPLPTYVKSTPIFVQGGKDKEVEGIISIKANRNVYVVDLDFIYKPSEATNNNTGIKDFRIKREVKVKRKEVFYVDHPLLGMIIELSPVVYQ